MNALVAGGPEEGWSALMLAVRRRLPLDTLLARTADVDVSASGKSALTLAVGAKLERAAVALLRRGADPSAATWFGDADFAVTVAAWMASNSIGVGPLLTQAMEARAPEDTICALVRLGAPRGAVAQVSIDGNVVRHTVASYAEAVGHTRLTKLLIARGAIQPPSTADKQGGGSSPLIDI